MNTWSGIYKKSFLDRYKIRHNTSPGAAFQDNGFWFQTFAHGRRAMIVDVPYYRKRRDNEDSSVHQTDKVYSVNEEYDFIRGILEQNTKLWNRFRGMYWKKKYENYIWNYNRIDIVYKKEYLGRIGREFKKGLKRGELDRQLFTKQQWYDIHLIIHAPQEYYRRSRRDEEIQCLQGEINRIENSMTYKIGGFILFLPKKIRKVLQRMRGVL